MRRQVQKLYYLLAGILLMAGAGFGMVHGVKAGVAQVMYRITKFGKVKDYPPRTTFRRCEEAHRLYPYNYYFCIWTAELAYYKRMGPDGREIPEYLDVAEQWCNRGLTLNNYNSQLRLLKTRLLAKRSIKDAIAYWEDYVNWHFWEPYNHAVLVELYSEAGELEKAMESLQWVEGSRHYDEAKQKLNQAWKKEMM